LRTSYTFAFLFLCIPLGQLSAMMLTKLIYGISSVEMLDILGNPGTADNSQLLVLAFFNSLFSFILIPMAYLSMVNKASITELYPKNRIDVFAFLLSILSIIAIAPFISFVIKLNYSIELPVWLSEFERNIKASDARSKEMTSALLALRTPTDLIAVIVVMAIVPGICEEVFFRGFLQIQLQNVLKNEHYAILFASGLFSLFHFQFYGFFPRLISGALLGYIFFWSKNIWYPIAVHIFNNLIALLLYNFSEENMKNSMNHWFVLIILASFSVMITVWILISVRKKIYRTPQMDH